MKKLVQKLLTVRVKPYYIYQCDLSRGIGHFRTTVSKGIEIVETCRGHTTGMAVPTFVVDAPGGGGKIPVMPSYLITPNEKRVILRNFEGVITTYDEPRHYEDSCGQCRICRDEPALKASCGVARLLDGVDKVIEPRNLVRAAATRRAERATGRSPASVQLSGSDLLGRVTFVTGAEKGCGKTTLVNRLLAIVREEGERPAILAVGLEGESSKAQAGEGGLASALGRPWSAAPAKSSSARSGTCGISSCLPEILDVLPGSTALGRLAIARAQGAAGSSSSAPSATSTRPGP